MATGQKSGFLKVEGDQITVDGKPIWLKGAGLGGWMNMENFITGYPGHEHQVRAALRRTLGEEKYEYFFDKFLEYFFTEEDAKFFASLGLNCIRLPINYRHFEDDMNPRVLKQEGFKHLDRVVDLCAKYGIYTVIDLHAAPGGQNFDWHSDSGSNRADFWTHKDFQDRALWLWEHLAEHYRDNTWIAGYNPLNEPTDEEHTRLVKWYEVAEKTIRNIDQNHILFFDGNTFGMDFSHFKDPLPNSVYACHDYSNYGFPMAPEPFTGTPEQKEYHVKTLERKTEYMRSIGGPIWNGEFGPVYASKHDDDNFDETNKHRYAVLEDQLSLYRKGKIHWSIWTYKDIGYQGMVHCDDKSPYMTLLKPFLDKKRSLAVDAWGVNYRTVAPVFDPISKWINEASTRINNRERYPKIWDATRHVGRALRETVLSEELCYEYASYFEGKSTEELDALAKSFAFDQCVQRTKLNEILREDAAQQS